jgi:hypothetical protein
MKKLCALLFLVTLFLFKNGTVAAQDLPSANCDVCGYCQGVTPVPPYRNPPSDWAKCRDCMYPELKGLAAESNQTLEGPQGVPTPALDNHYTVVGCISTQPGKFTTQLSNIFFSLIGGVAFLFLLYGAALIAMSRSDYEKLNQGKRIVFGAIAGLLFVLFATFIIRVIAVNILKIPGFGQ